MTAGKRWSPPNPDSISVAYLWWEADRCGLRHARGSDSTPLWNRMNDHCRLVGRAGRGSFQRRERHRVSSVTGKDMTDAVYQFKARSGRWGAANSLLCDRREVCVSSHPAIHLWLIRAQLFRLCPLTEQLPVFYSWRRLWDPPEHIRRRHTLIHTHKHKHTLRSSALMLGWQRPLEMRWWGLSCWHVHPGSLSHLHTKEV